MKEGKIIKVVELLTDKFYLSIFVKQKTINYK